MMRKESEKEEVPEDLTFFQFEVEEFSVYQKQCSSDYKSRAQKRKERVEKLTKYLHDPEQKKLKKQEQRKIQKEKLHQTIDKMTKEEARIYLDNIKNNKEQLKKKVRAAMGTGQVFMIDMVYEHQMNEKENRSLAKQVELIMKVIKHFDRPPSIHLCSVEGQIQQQLAKMGVKYWAVTPHQDGILQTAEKLGKKTIYLSPDAPLELQSIDNDTAYILGGLVDRSILKNASLQRAQELGIEARRLPISQFMKGRLCLNLDHVVNMICKYVECQSWKEAFDFAAPKRWKKQEGQLEKQESTQQELIKLETQKRQKNQTKLEISQNSESRLQAVPEQAPHSVVPKS